jgi:hypothetical protein
LIEGSSLEALLSDRHDVTLVDGKKFVERDPVIFRTMIEFLEDESIMIFDDDSTGVIEEL